MKKLQRQFEKQLIAMMKEWSCKSETFNIESMHHYEKVTNYGTLNILFDRNTDSKVFSIYLRFNQEGFLKDQFLRLFCKNTLDSFNEYSYKWNIHTFSIEQCIDELDTRLNALTYPIN